MMHVWAVDRSGEEQRFAQHSGLANRKLLWHGTNVAVVAAIIKSGLRIMPHSGGRVGRGIYFADMLGKSLGYTRGASWKGVFQEVVFLAEVALGKENHITIDNGGLMAAPTGFDCVIAKG